MELKQSETMVVRRSQINLNPLNPKRHTEQAINLQKKNLRKVGYLGGVVWNKVTGNLIDGHRRVYALDAIMKYDGTEATDYEIKVEVVAFDEKTEKEQMTYMAVGDTQADLDLIARYIDGIDYADLGLDDVKLGEILSIAGISNEDEEVGAEQFILDDVLENTETGESKIRQMSDEYAETHEGAKEMVAPRPPMTQEEKTAHVKEVKRQQNEMAENYTDNSEAYIVLSFEEYSSLQDFCEFIGVPENVKYVKGEMVLQKIQ